MPNRIAQYLEPVGGRLPKDPDRVSRRPLAPPTALGRAVHVGSIALLALCALAIVIALPYLKRDALIWNLTVMFGGVTLASCGAMGGIVLFVFGAARRQFVRVGIGLIIGLGSFLALALLIGWAIHKDINLDSLLVPPPGAQAAMQTGFV